MTVIAQYLPAGGTWAGDPVNVRLELDCENPVTYSGVLVLPSGKRGLVKCWTSVEHRFLIEISCHDALYPEYDDGRVLIRAEGSEFQKALDELRSKLDAVRAWAATLLTAKEKP